MLIFYFLKFIKYFLLRIIGYLWIFVYGIGKYGISLKIFYRIMIGLDILVLMVIKDSDG